MTRRAFSRALGCLGAAGAMCLMGLSGCAAGEARVENDGATDSASDDSGSQSGAPRNEYEAVQQGVLVLDHAEERGFTLDNVYHAPEVGDVHFSLHLPDSYGEGLHALYVALPGYEGLYFQGVGANLQEEFPFASQEYDDAMIVVSPQLEDWGQTSAAKTVALVRFLLQIYSVDASRVFISGYSGGGETLSLVLDEAPELFAAALHCSSQWDGGFDALTDTRTPIRFVIGEGDEYYGPESVQDAYNSIVQRYRDAGLSDAEIAGLVVLDVKDDAYFEEYFSSGGQAYQHAAGAVLFAQDQEVMGWFFSHAR